MTEEQAYEKLGWPLEGDLLRFILPATGDHGSWRAAICDCGYRSIYRVTPVLVDLPLCEGCGNEPKEL